MNPKGSPLNPADYAALAARWIEPSTADAAFLRRVDSTEGGEICGRNGSGDYAGIIIPYCRPGADRVSEYRLRVDHPPMERDYESGKLKPQYRYLSPPRGANRIYIPPSTETALLGDASTPVVLTEGEFKTLSLYQLSLYGVDVPRFLSLGLSGVWNFKGVIGKTHDETGTRVDEKGVIEDFDRIAWTGRRVVIAYDADLKTKPNVQAARRALTSELHRRGAVVYFFPWPAEVPPDQKGIDDYLAAHGPDVVLQMIAESTPAKALQDATPRMRVADVPLLSTLSTDKPTFVYEGMLAIETVTMVTGDSGSGKSTYALAVAGAIAAGQMLAGLQAYRAPVLYLDRENPLSVIQERRERLGIEDGPFFRIWGGWCPQEAPDPGSEVVKDWVRSCAPRPTIFVDSLSAFMRDSENDADSARRFMDQLRGLANMGCCVVVLHHIGKSETAKEFRGSSDLKASIDVGYLLTRSGNPDRLDLLKLKTFKARFEVTPEFTFRYVDGEFHAGHGGLIVTNGERLTDLLRANPGVKTADFEKLALKHGLPRVRARTFIANGIEAGTIQVQVGANNAKFLTLSGGQI